MVSFFVLILKKKDKEKGNVKGHDKDYRTNVVL